MGGYSGDGGLAVQALLNHPTDVTVDALGNLYFVDQSNHRIRKVDTVGVITTVAGNGSFGYSGDGGPAIQARLSITIGGLAVDSFGNLFFGDSGNRRVRKVNTSGIISTVAGNGSSGYSGDGGPALKAQLMSASDVLLDSAGNLYIADYGNRRVRKVDTSGVITTVAGNGSLGYSGNGGPAVKAQLNHPSELAIDNSGNLYIITNCQIRKVTPVPATFADGMTSGALAFAEESGVGHVMNANGLHKSTIDLDTGVALYNFSYDQQDNLVSITDQFGNEMIIERAADGAPTAVISPDGLRTTLAINSYNHLVRITYPDSSHYDFEYTSGGLLTGKIDPNGNHFRNGFDAQGRLMNISDDQGGLWQYLRENETNGDIRVEKLSAEGNLTTYLDHTDSTGAYTSIITDPTGAQTLYSRSADGLSAQKSLSCGMSLSFQYGLDPEYGFEFVKQVTETTPLGLAKNISREKTYVDTNADKLPDQITEKVTANGQSTTILTDTLQSSEVVTSAAGRTVTALYDPAMLLTTRISIPQLYETNFGYDTEGRVTSVDINTRQTSFTYDSQGNLASITDPENHSTTYAHDLVGRVTGIQRPDGSILGFTYDPNGNMTVLTNPVDVDHAFGFNQVNLPNTYQTPISGSYSYQYDRDRDLIQTTLPSGKKIHNIYTAGQLTQIQTPQGNIDLTYDCGSKIASMTKDGEVITYTYDGKLMTDVSSSGTLDQSLGLTYNDDFNVTAFTYAGSSAAMSYDADGLLIGADDFTITRNAQNGLPEYVSSNGLNVARSFNGYGEQNGQSVTVNSQPILQWSLTRDNAGRIITKTETTEGESHTFEYGYDELGRLLTVTCDGVRIEEYSYDLSGTRTSETNTLRDITTRGFSYSDEDHLLTSGEAVYAYDLDGFLAKKTEAGQVTTYTYSTRGELLQVILPDGRSISYQHDPLGRRIAKRIDGVIVEKYLWLGLTKLLAVYDGSDNLVQRFEYADDRMPVAMTKNGSTYFLAYDQVGTLRAVTDGSGNLVKRIDYDTFGNIIADSNPEFSVPFGFAGGLSDRDTGLVRFGYRDYDPNTGRWTAKDPIGFAGGDTDLYGYVANDPVNWIDPDGLYKFLIKQFVQRTIKAASNSYYRNFDPAGRRIISAGIAGAAGGAVAGALVGTPVLGLGAAPSALGGSIIGFSAGLLIQTSMEAVGLGQAIEDLTSQLIQHLLDAIKDDSQVSSPCT
jgi:RHS repeat-associated protein